MNHEEKSRIQSMQTLSSQHPNPINQHTRKIAFIAILLFALSGLISGFAVGAFVHSKPRGSGTTPTSSGTTPIAKETRTSVSTTIAEHVNLDLPVINQGDYSYFQCKW